MTEQVCAGFSSIMAIIFELPSSTSPYGRVLQTQPALVGDPRAAGGTPCVPVSVAPAPGAHTYCSASPSLGTGWLVPLLPSSLAAAFSGRDAKSLKTST